MANSVADLKAAIVDMGKIPCVNVMLLLVLAQSIRRLNDVG